MEKLTKSDIDIILDSLKYTKMKFENYPIGPDGYPDYEFKQQRLREVDKVIEKLRSLTKI